MPFKVGNPGKPKGTIHKRTLEFRAVLEAAGFCPATALLETYKIALAQFADDLEKLESGRISPMESSAAQYLKIACDVSKELASYSYPKLKAIEQQKPDPLIDMTPVQKLEAMRQAVKMLEAETKP
jgi:hypothetical protein